MSSIDRLTISGIRAFDPKQIEVIDFGTPLTLIVGHNGAGKTTIIEALKYATAGIMPPTSKSTGMQSSFLHDPNIDHERETNAQIKVRIRTANKATITGTRNMTVSLKKGKLSFDAKDGAILVERNGEKSSASHRKTQLDAQLPAWLGVSPAVLDRVIFCHQDESLWPMSASKDLKEYFDALFEIEKYAKAITELNNLKNKQKKAIDLHKKDELHYKTDKDRGARAQKEISSLKIVVSTLDAEVEQLRGQIAEAQEKANEAEEHRNRTGLIVGELFGKRMEAKVKKESLQNLRQNLQELSDDTETLEDMAAQYEERCEEYKQSSEQSRVDLAALQQSVDRTRTLLSNEEREVGMNEAQRTNHERQLSLRQDLIRTVAQRHDIRGFTGDISDHQVQVFLERIQRMAREQGTVADTAKQESSLELQGIQKILDASNERRATLSARKDNAKKLIQDNEHKIDRAQREHDNIEADEGAKSIQEQQFSDCEAKLRDAKDSVQAAAYENAESLANTELQNVQGAKRTLEAELGRATESLKETASLDLLRTSLSDLQQRLSTMINAHRDKLAAIVGDSWQPVDVKQRFDKALDKAETALSEAQKQRDNVGRELEQAEFKISTVQSKIKQGEAVVKSSAATISQVIATGPDGYHSEIEELENSRDTIKGDADSFEVMMRYLDQCIKDAQVHKVCRTCTRALKDKDIEALKKSMEREKKKFDLASTNNDLARVEEDLKEAKAVASHVETWERLTKTELPALRAELLELEQQRTSILQRHEAEDDVFSERANAKREVEAVSKNVTNIATLHNEIIANEKSLKDLSAKLQQSGMVRDLKSINEDRESKNEEELAARLKLKKILDEKSRSDKLINNLELELRDARVSLAGVIRQLADKAAKEKDIEELKGANAAQRTAIKACDTELEAARQELNEAQEKYDDASVRARLRDKQLQADASKINDSLNQLKVAQQEIESYIDSDGPGRLARSQAAVVNYKTQIKQLQGQAHEIAINIQTIDERLRDHNETKRNIDENLRYRRDTQLLKQVQQDIRELESHDAEAEREQYEDEFATWTLKKNALIAEQGEKNGAFSSEVATLKKRQEEWTLNFQHAASNYRKAHINVEVTQACAKDLARYAGALDQAIMKFHSIKMDEINRIVDELWRKTYQGTDVDTIFIESDAEGASNKNYNYRVCMRKGATIMDMRGRCSAGQKVLACIIIRLALAECFGVNCGLIALDEPTTNLDRENAQALALALAELIRARRAQKNFQIIIITHDEEFLKFMTPSNYVDFYFRVSRTSKQKSHIEREQISYLMRR